MSKIVILTGNELRHNYYISEISKKLDVVGAVREEKIYQANKFKENADEFNVAQKHFESRKKSEEKFFKDKIKSEFDFELLDIKNGTVNSHEVFEWVKNKNPDYILLFGCSLIKEPLISYYENKIINLHLGLSPYYRGGGTNFWPLVNKQPELVGGTIHLAVLKVDAGDILKQVRPDVNAADGPHDLGNKTIIKAIENIPDVVKEYEKGIRKPIRQNLEKGLVYKRKDLTTEGIKQLYENFDSGMIAEYLNSKEEKIKLYPIVE
ncbi:MAG TPA: formyltransferase family protein [Ignavibacteria bacterium]|nr:formyltransferase family protein [Ignavibacteria bacterium]